MNQETIEIPKKWYLTLFRDHYFAAFREMFYNEGRTLERTFYEFEEKREQVGLPPAYLTFDSFIKQYYKWTKEKQEGNGKMAMRFYEERYKLR
jgi:hypothetical protein